LLVSVKIRVFTEQIPFKTGEKGVLPLFPIQRHGLSPGALNPLKPVNAGTCQPALIPVFWAKVWWD
jgi:hypothetical protein